MSKRVCEMNEAEFTAFIETEICPLVAPVKQPTLNVEALRNRYPHLSELCNYFERAAALTTLREDKIFALPSPVILVGEPGCGKTDFCFFVADALHAESELFDCASASAGFLLTGMSSVWRGAKRGLIYTLVHERESAAKPFLILDELDKAGGDSQHPILPVLGGLFEPGTAAKFKDEFKGEAADARAINFICTANAIEAIPPHILDRCDVIFCPQPDAAQKLTVVKSLWEDLRRTLNAEAFTLEHSATEAMGAVSLRKVKHILTQAVAIAVLAGKTVVGAVEVRAAMGTGAAVKQKIGFL